MLGAILIWSLGRWIVRIDPLERADAIYVLGGSPVERALEAADLFREGYAPLILMSPGRPEAGQLVLERQGIQVPNSAEIMRGVMVGRLGIPPAAVEVLPGEIDNTAQEASELLPRVRSGGWRRLIVITGCANSRRAGLAFRRAVDSTVSVIVRCSRYDLYDPRHWWRTRGDARMTISEVPKLIAYWLGLKG